MNYQYDTTVPRSRLSQRVSEPEAISRSFDHRANALIVSQSQGEPYYADSDGTPVMTLTCTNAGETKDFSPNLHHTVSLYAKQTAGAGGFAVKVFAKTQLGDYIEIFSDNAFSPLKEYRVVTANRNIRVQGTASVAGDSFTVYAGGE